jgi:HNH endonuclease
MDRVSPGPTGVQNNNNNTFPLAYEGEWHRKNYDRWITVPPKEGGKVYSVQNGLLLRCDIHQLFDAYGVSINPDVCVPCISTWTQ